MQHNSGNYHTFWLSESHPHFPHPNLARPDGVLAVGGDLSQKRLLSAYRQGIFPWFNPEDPIIWWSPDPRFVLFPEDLRVSKSMRPYFNQKKFEVTMDTDFLAIIDACAKAKREGQSGGTWITEEMKTAYLNLHQEGYAHSIEVRKNGEIVGGLYGIALGKCFFGESMFAKESNASKFGFITLTRRLQELGFWMIDCQQPTRHLASLGALNIPRTDFLKILKRNEAEKTLRGNWQNLLQIAPEDCPLISHERVEI